MATCDTTASDTGFFVAAWRSWGAARPGPWPSWDCQQPPCFSLSPHLHHPSSGTRCWGLLVLLLLLLA